MGIGSKVIVNSTTLARNTRAIKQSLSAQCRFMAVVQNNAYAHGAVECSRIALENGVDWLAVGNVDEGVILRENGIAAPILVLGRISPKDVDNVIRWNLSCAVSEPEIIIALESAAKQKKAKVKVHLEVDTGLHRHGISGTNNYNALFSVWKRCPNVLLEAAFTQFTDAENPNKAFLFEQQEKFLSALAFIKVFAGDNLLLHAANTAATLDVPACHFDMVRCGIGLYGYYPSQYVNHSVSLSPVLQWETEVSSIFVLSSGESLGYTESYRAKSDRTIAVIPVGYADGYKRSFEGRAQVLIAGNRVPVVGQICMNQCMVDISDIADKVELSDQVVLLGEQLSAKIDADELALWANSSSYEILCSISLNVPRIYV